MEQLAELKTTISTPKRIVIIPHYRPDADALGTSLALAAWLRKKQHTVCVVAPSEYPKFLDWMPGTQEVIVHTRQPQQASEVIDKAEVIFCVDFQSLSRINDLEPLVRQSTATKVVIDHHPNPENFADLTFRDVQAAATAELLYRMIDASGEKSTMDADIANCLYAGIVTDTGSFKHANTTTHTHLTAARLLEHGANAPEVSRLIYDNHPLKKLQFLGFAISERLVVLEEHNAAYFFIRQEDYQQYHLQTGDTEGLVGQAMSIKGVEFAIAIREKRDRIRLSFRSSGDIFVNLFAQAHFQGGGHKNAAGGTSYLSLADTITKLEALVKAKEHLLKP